MDLLQPINKEETQVAFLLWSHLYSIDILFTKKFFRLMTIFLCIIGHLLPEQRITPHGIIERTEVYVLCRTTGYSNGSNLCLEKTLFPTDNILRLYQDIRISVQRQCLIFNSPSDIFITTPSNSLAGVHRVGDALRCRLKARYRSGIQRNWHISRRRCQSGCCTRGYRHCHTQ